MTYLDVKLVVTEDRKLETDRHIKETNPQLFLPYTSNHPESCFKSIVHGQAITVRMICSQEKDVIRHIKLLQQKFEERGYPSNMVQQYLQKGLLRERNDLLKPKPQYPHAMVPPPVNIKPIFRPTFIITYNPHNPPLRTWLKEAYDIIKSSTTLREIYPKPPSVTFRQAPNLKRMLTNSRFKELPFNGCQDLGEYPTGCYKHNHNKRGAKCQLCPMLKESTTFTSTFTGLSYKMRYRFTCKSRYCVYLVTCAKCGGQYCGSTTDYMHIRHTGHRQEIRGQSSELGRHFSECGYDKMSIQIIDCVKTDLRSEDSVNALRYLEGVWQTKLGCFTGQGNINVRNEMRHHRGRIPQGITQLLNI